ncbi:MAG: nitrous oxide-stimulated promoter family protein [Desulfobacterales bacterium]|nr:nitrous oxide-stimulated promoter family protein [Desulfobacterales bacterium]
MRENEPPRTQSFSPRIKREIKTIKAMIRIYCKAHHNGGKNLCENCQKLQNYSITRLANCPFQEHKTTCGTCSVHCYKTSMKKEIIDIMRYSGPRMMLHHPVLALAHLLDEKRSVSKNEE